MNKQKIMQVVTLGLAVGVGVAILRPWSDGPGPSSAQLPA